MVGWLALCRVSKSRQAQSKYAGCKLSKSEPKGKAKVKEVLLRNRKDDRDLGDWMWAIDMQLWLTDRPRNVDGDAYTASTKVSQRGLRKELGGLLRSSLVQARRDSQDEDDPANDGAYEYRGEDNLGPQKMGRQGGGEYKMPTREQGGCYRQVQAGAVATRRWGTYLD